MNTRLKVSQESKKEVLTICDSSSDSDDEIRVSIRPAKERRKMPALTEDIDTKASEMLENVYTSKFLKYREMSAKISDAPLLMKNKANFDISEGSENIFTRGPKKNLSRRKILKEKDVSGSKTALNRLTPPNSLPLDFEIPKIVKMSQQSASILRELDEIASDLRNPVGSNKTMNTSAISLDDCEIVEDLVIARNIVVKIRWRGSIIRLPTKDDEKFATILPVLAKEIGAEVTDIFLTIKEITIKPSDTPDGLHMTSADILDCFIIKNVTETVEDENVIELKLQSENRWKKVFKIHTDSPMQKLIEECAAEKDILPSKIVFKFDGETIDPSETPADLDLETGHCIDVTFLT